jgi:uncharacterized Zn finger protein (UPF0148 family)
MTDEICPYCGLKLLKNIYGDLVCPNHGIVSEHEEDNKDTQSYFG